MAEPLPRPRMTKLADKQASILLPAWQSVSSDPDVADSWQACFEVLPENDSTILLSRVLALDAIIRHRSPTLARFYGRHLFGTLFEMLIYRILRVHQGATHEEASAFIIQHLPPMKTERVMPDILLTIGLDGSITIPPETKTADIVRHSQVIRDYRRSLRPPKKLGRPTGIVAPKQKGRLDADKARQAYQMYLAGKHWREIARLLLRGIDLYVHSDLAYQRVRRLVDYGRRLDQA